MRDTGFLDSDAMLVAVLRLSFGWFRSQVIRVHIAENARLFSTFWSAQRGLFTARGAGGCTDPSGATRDVLCCGGMSTISRHWGGRGTIFRIGENGTVSRILWRVGAPKSFNGRPFGDGYGRAQTQRRVSQFIKYMACFLKRGRRQGLFDPPSKATDFSHRFDSISDFTCNGWPGNIPIVMLYKQGVSTRYELSLHRLGFAYVWTTIDCKNVLNQQRLGSFELQTSQSRYI